MSPEPTRLHVNVLRHLAAGRTLDDVALIADVSRDAILDLAARHGYPDQDKLAWAADVLDEQVTKTENAIAERSAHRRSHNEAVAS